MLRNKVQAAVEIPEVIFNAMTEVVESSGHMGQDDFVTYAIALALQSSGHLPEEYLRAVNGEVLEYIFRKHESPQ